LLFNKLSFKKNNCASYPKPAPAPNVPNAEGPSIAVNIESKIGKISAKYPGYTKELHEKGEVLYKKNCGSCHELYRAQSFTQTAWLEIMPRMVNNVNQREKILSADQASLIEKYLMTSAQE
jgi:mono/diheme cytochrome c family protein